MHLRFLSLLTLSAILAVVLAAGPASVAAAKTVEVTMTVPVRGRLLPGGGYLSETPISVVAKTQLLLPIRAGPLVILGGGLVSWGMATLGSKRTSGLVDGLIAEGPYLFTRNPQYVGDLLLFVGVIVFSNSAVVAVTHLFTALVLLVGPIIEEPWLEEHYEDAYVGYRKNVPRYL